MSFLSPESSWRPSTSGATLHDVKWHETNLCHLNDLPLTVYIGKHVFIAGTSTFRLISSFPQMKKAAAFQTDHVICELVGRCIFAAV